MKTLQRAHGIAVFGAPPTKATVQVYRSTLCIAFVVVTDEFQGPQGPQLNSTFTKPTELHLGK
jgi:hypothetical protein